ncbi:hypothetical protein JCM8208_004342 [Rhodotorula glutinis]
MSNTHALEQPRPFDRLPTELLVKMLRHLPPPMVLLSDGDSPPYIENTLFAVSLVSRRFHASNRNLMWQGLTIEAESTPATLLQAIALVAKWPAIAQVGHELRINELGDRPPRDWAVLLPSADRLVARRFGPLELVDFACFHALRHLSLDDCAIDLSPPITLPRLESLRLSYSAVTSAPPGASSRAFPILRHLVLECTEGSGVSAVEPVFDNAFLAKLDSLEVAATAWHERADDNLLPLEDPPSSLPILWHNIVRVNDHLHDSDQALSTSSIPFGQHLLLRIFRWAEVGVPTSVGWERVCVEVRRVVALHKHARLRLVLVAGAPWPRPGATPPELAALEALEGDCQRRGVVLRSCEVPRVEDGPVPEFIEFLREEATRAAAEGA